MLDHVTFNLYVGNEDPRGNTARMLDAAGDPHVAHLQEAQRLGRSPAGYRLLRGDADELDLPARDAHDCALLVRDDVDVIRFVARQVPDGDWAYEDNRRHARTWVRAILKHRGVISEAWGIHRVPLGPRPPRPVNRRAWAAEHQFLSRWAGNVARRHPDRCLVIGGDWNSRLGKAPKAEHSLERLARQLGAQAHLRSIDGFLVINPSVDTPARPVVPNVRRLERGFGSDAHHPVLLT